MEYLLFYFIPGRFGSCDENVEAQIEANYGHVQLSPKQGDVNYVITVGRNL